MHGGFGWLLHGLRELCQEEPILQLRRAKTAGAVHTQRVGRPLGRKKLVAKLGMRTCGAPQNVSSFFRQPEIVGRNERTTVVVERVSVVSSLTEQIADQHQVFRLLATDPEAMGHALRGIEKRKRSLGVAQCILRRRELTD